MMWRGCLLVATILAGVGCELSSNLDDSGTDPGAEFSAQVQPILNAKCVSCHGAADSEADLDLTSWSGVLAGSEFGDVVVSYRPTRSLLLRLTTERVGGNHPGELGSDTLSVSEAEILRDWILRGAPDDGGTVAFETVENPLYVASQTAATVSVIDMDAQVVARVVDLTDHGYSALSKPHHVAVEPDGSRWYVSLIGANAVAKFDRANNRMAEFEFETPGMLAVDPVNDWLYAGRSLSAASPPASIGKIQRSDMTGEEIAVVFPRPHALVADPSGAFVYSASLGQNQIIAYEEATGDVTFVAVAGPVHAFVQHAVSPDGALLASSGQLTANMLFFDLAVPETPAFAWSVGVNAAPWHPVFSPDGRFVYVGNKDANTVTVISVTDRRVERIVTGAGIAEPHGAAVSPDGRYLFVSNRNTRGAYTPRHELRDNESDGTVVVIDLNSGQVTRVLEVGELAAGLGTR